MYRYTLPLFSVNSTSLSFINVKPQGAEMLLSNTLSSNNSGVCENPGFAKKTSVAIPITITN
jgi:hypothetical protein